MSLGAEKNALTFNPLYPLVEVMGVIPGSQHSDCMTDKLF